MRPQAAQTLWSKLAWFVGLWLAGVSVVGAAGLVVRAGPR
jgi:hypothetical protein